MNPFGILFVILAALAWFAWDAVIGGYTSAGFGPGGAELPLLARFAPVFIKGVTKSVADLESLGSHPASGLAHAASAAGSGARSRPVPPEPLTAPAPLSYRVDLPRFSGEALAHSAAVFSN